MEAKKKKIEKLKNKISKLEGKDIPKTKGSLIKKILVGSGIYGGIKEAAEQIAAGDMSVKDLLMSVITSPVTVIKDARDFMQEDKKGMAMGGMAEMRKKGMGLRMANGGEVPSKFKGFSKLPESVQEQMSPTLAKKYEKGGVVKKRATRTKKSRGSGAAIKGTKFKGVF